MKKVWNYFFRWQRVYTLPDLTPNSILNPITPSCPRHRVESSPVPWEFLKPQISCHYTHLCKGFDIEKKSKQRNLGDGSYILIEAPRPQGGASRHCIISFILCPLTPPIPQGVGRGTFRPITIKYKLFYWSRHFCPMSRADSNPFSFEAASDNSPPAPYNSSRFPYP